MCACQDLVKYHSQCEIIRDVSLTLTPPGEMEGDVDQSVFEYACQSAM